MLIKFHMTNSHSLHIELYWLLLLLVFVIWFGTGSAQYYIQYTVCACGLISFVFFNICLYLLSFPLKYRCSFSIAIRHFMQQSKSFTGLHTFHFLFYVIGIALILRHFFLAIDTGILLIRHIALCQKSIKWFSLLLFSVLLVFNCSLCSPTPSNLSLFLSLSVSEIIRLCNCMIPCCLTFCCSRIFDWGSSCGWLLKPPSSLLIHLK